MIKQGKRQMQAENSRKKLLTTAGTLFFQYGYHAVSVNDICREAGLTKGAFYYHFASKDELYRQLFTPQLDAYLDEHYDLPPQTGARERLVRLAECTFEMSKKLGRELMAQNTIAMVAQRSSNLFVANRTHTRLLDEAIAKGIEEGSLRAQLDRDGYIMLYACMMNGFLLKWEAADEQDDARIDWLHLLRQEIALMARD